MRAWTLKDGIAVAGIQLTEHGPACGRSERRLGLHLSGGPIACLPIAAGSTVTDGRLVDSPGDGALLLVRDHSGVDGSWHLRGAHPPERWDELVSSWDHADPLGRIMAAELVRARYPRRATAGWTELSRHSTVHADSVTRRRKITIYGHLDDGASMELRRRGHREELEFGGRSNVLLIVCRNGSVTVSDPLEMAKSRRQPRLLRP